MKKVVPVIIVLAIVVAGCSRTDLDPRPAASGGDAGVTAAAAGGDAGVIVADAVAHADLTSAPTGADRDCIIAIRTDTCCSEPFVISLHEMDEDPCIQEYLSGPPAAECVARRPSSCDTTDCAFWPPLTRTVGRIAGGSCQFLSECETDADCVWTFDLRECCGCPAYYPRTLVASDGCLSTGEPNTATSCSNTVCGSVRCAQPSCPQQSAACTADSRQAAAGLKACNSEA
jgi:hypothetical protein